MTTETPLEYLFRVDPERHAKIEKERKEKIWITRIGPLLMGIWEPGITMAAQLSPQTEKAALEAAINAANDWYKHGKLSCRWNWKNEDGHPEPALAFGRIVAPELGVDEMEAAGLALLYLDSLSNRTRQTLREADESCYTRAIDKKENWFIEAWQKRIHEI